MICLVSSCCLVAPCVWRRWVSLRWCQVQRACRFFDVGLSRALVGGACLRLPFDVCVSRWWGRVPVYNDVRACLLHAFAVAVDGVLMHLRGRVCACLCMFVHLCTCLRTCAHECAFPWARFGLNLAGLRVFAHVCAPLRMNAHACGRALFESC